MKEEAAKGRRPETADRTRRYACPAPGGKPPRPPLVQALASGALVAAPRLIGCLLRHDTPQGVVAGRILETEAYTHDDPASHSFRGPTPRNASMFAPPGTAYVYLIYGLHYCFNIATGPEGTGEAVLIRALVIERGSALAHTRRGPAVRHDHLLANGPGKLCQALAIDRSHDGLSLLAPRAGALSLLDGAPAPGGHILVTPRIGIRLAADWPRRFLWQPSPSPTD